MMPQVCGLCQAKGFDHSLTDRIEILSKHLRRMVGSSASFPELHPVESGQSHCVQHVALRPRIPFTKAHRQGQRIHPMMKRLYRVRGGGTQRNDGAEAGPRPPAWRNNHHRTGLDHFWGHEPNKVAHQQCAGFWLEGEHLKLIPNIRRRRVGHQRQSLTRGRAAAEWYAAGGAARQAAGGHCTRGAAP